MKINWFSLIYVTVM